MRRQYTIVLGVLGFILSIGGCGNGGNEDRVNRQSSSFEEDRMYVHLLTIDGVCKNGKNISADPIINCSFRVIFQKNGIASLILTDIANLGVYEISGKSIVYRDDDGEISQYRFTIQDDRTIVSEDSIVWVLEE